MIFCSCRIRQVNLYNLRVQNLEIVKSNGQNYFKTSHQNYKKNHQGITNKTESTVEGGGGEGRGRDGAGNACHRF